MTAPGPTPDLVPLTDVDLLRAVVRLDPDVHQTATWGEILKGLVDAGTVSFPIDSIEQLRPVFDRGAQLGLEGPRPELVPAGIFPIPDYDAFVHRVFAHIRFQHHFGPIRKMPPMRPA